MEPLWLPPRSPLPSPLCALRRRAGGRIGFPLQLKGYFSPSRGWKDDYFPSPSSIRLFFQVRGSGRKETITCGVKGGLGTRLPALSGRKRIWIGNWMGRNPRSLETAGNDPRKTSAAPPPSPSRPVLSESVSYNGLSLQKKRASQAAGDSLKAHGLRQACVKALTHKNHQREQAQRRTLYLL